MAHCLPPGTSYFQLLNVHFSDAADVETKWGLNSGHENGGQGYSEHATSINCSTECGNAKSMV